MAERSLKFAGTATSRADRYQVILHVQKKDLEQGGNSVNCTNIMHVHNQDTPHNPAFPPIPSKRPWIEGAGAISHEVAKRITCDCSIVSMLFDKGEPLNVGRKTRIWPSAIERTIKTRDRHCQYPGCDEHRHLEIHHIQHWSEGGETSLDNGICLCSAHHSLMHEGGYRIERVDSGRLQSRAKLLLPTRYRFRFFNTEGAEGIAGHADFYSSRSSVREGKR